MGQVVTPLLDLKLKGAREKAATWLQFANEGQRCTCITFTCAAFGGACLSRTVVRHIATFFGSRATLADSGSAAVLPVGGAVVNNILNRFSY